MTTCMHAVGLVVCCVMVIVKIILLYNIIWKNTSVSLLLTLKAGTAPFIGTLTTLKTTIQN